MTDDIKFVSEAEQFMTYEFTTKSDLAFIQENEIVGGEADTEFRFAVSRRWGDPTTGVITKPIEDPPKIVPRL